MHGCCVCASCPRIIVDAYPFNASALIRRPGRYRSSATPSTAEALGGAYRSSDKHYSSRHPPFR